LATNFKYIENYLYFYDFYIKKKQQSGERTLVCAQAPACASFIQVRVANLWQWIFWDTNIKYQKDFWITTKSKNVDT